MESSANPLGTHWYGSTQPSHSWVNCAARDSSFMPLTGHRRAVCNPVTAVKKCAFCNICCLSFLHTFQVYHPSVWMESTVTLHAPQFLPRSGDSGCLKQAQSEHKHGMRFTTNTVGLKTHLCAATKPSPCKDKMPQLSVLSVIFEKQVKISKLECHTANPQQ